MNIANAIREVSEQSGMTLSSISRLLNKQNGYVSGVITRGKCPSVDNAAAIFRAAGYVMCVVPDTNIPNGAIVIDTTLEEVKMSGQKRYAEAMKERERRRKALLAELERLDNE